MPLFIRENGWRHYYGLSSEPKPDGTLLGAPQGRLGRGVAWLLLRPGKEA